MKNLQTILIPAVIFAMLFSMCGCEESATVEHAPVIEVKPVFFPSSPDKPRLQFLTSFSTDLDLKPSAPKEKPSGFEMFLFGEEEVEMAKESISKPYGMAIYEGKLYVCDVQKKLVREIDLVNKTFGYLTKERRMTNPVNIYIEKGWKYIADPIAGAVFVYGRDNTLKAILGKKLEIKPIDVEVRGRNCYVTDMARNQIVVLDRITGEEITRMGSQGGELGKFVLIGDLAMDSQKNIYVTDKIMARITKYSNEGLFQMSIGKISTAPKDMIRPKGIDVDKEGRIWVVDTGPEITKIYNHEGALMMSFGFPGGGPGSMSMPASVLLDYDNVDLFKEYFVEGAQIEMLVFVSNQYGMKINVYGFGEFPLQEAEYQKEFEEMGEAYTEESTEATE